jgi:stage II sporulation protein M
MAVSGYAKRTFAFMTGLFFLFVFVGGVIAYADSSLAEKFLKTVLRELIGKINPNASSFVLFVEIFLNNVGVATMAYALGVLFGIVPAIIVAFNGLMLGVFITYFVRSGVISLRKAILGILPHGIVEIPAILLAATSGVLLYEALLRNRGDKMAIESLKLYALSLAMLLVAAFIEAFITPKIAGLPN